MKRRAFIQKTSVGLGGALVSPALLGCVQNPNTRQDGFPNFNVRKLTDGPKHHFFGYYGISPWNRSQTHLLSFESDFQDHMPGLNESAGIGLVDPYENEAHPELEHKHIWFNHTVFNKSDTRFFLLARTRDDKSGSLETGMFTVGIDGSDLREVIPYGSSVSHFDWRNDKEIIATFSLNSGGRQVYIIKLN